MSGLKRYTQLPYLLHMLSTREITALNPRFWADRNDAFFLQAYQEERKLESIVILCLSRSAATYHHWHVFAHGPAGIRIEFDERHFTEWARQIEHARLERVEYVKLDPDLIAQIKPEQLPFVKRHAFRHEGEVRLIVENHIGKAPRHSFKFDYEMIKEVVVSPWLAPAAVPSVVQAIRSAAPASRFKIRSTTMLESEIFLRAAGNNPSGLAARALATKKPSIAR